MERKPTIGIDVDGVLRDNLGIMVDLYNDHFGGNMTIDDIKDYRTEITFPGIFSATGKTASEWFFQDHSDEIFVKAKCFENVAEDIKKLRNYANVVIISYQKTVKNKIDTLKWLESNGIEYDGVIFMKDKTKFICDILIDDNDWNFINSNAGYGALINAPYNISKDVNELKEKSHCSCIERYDNLHEFITRFLLYPENFLDRYYRYDVYCIRINSPLSSPLLLNSCMTQSEADELIADYKKEDKEKGYEDFFNYFVRERKQERRN